MNPDFLDALIGRSSFAEYVKRVELSFRFNWHHQLIMKKLQDVEAGIIKKLTISMPPRHTKSMLTSELFPSWFLGKNPTKSIIATSYASTLATDFGRKVRNRINSDEFKRIFGQIGLADDSTANNRFHIQHHGGSYVAVGAGGSLTGRGGSVIICDDAVQNDQEARNQATMQKLYEWFGATLYTRLQPDGAIIVIGTRWSEFDLIGKIKEHDTNKEWEHLVLPAINEPKYSALWPDWISNEALLKIKAQIGTRAFEALYQQNPTPIEGNIIKRDHIKHWSKLPDTFTEVIQSWDLAFKGEQTSDFVVGQVWGRAGSQYYLIDQIRARMDFTQTIEAFKTLSKKYPHAIRKIVEDAANAAALHSVLSKEIQGITLKKKDKDKVSYCNAITPLFEAGNVFLPPPNQYQWVQDLIEEITAFPNGKNDDAVDSMTQALNHFAGKPLPVFINVK